MDIIDRKQQFSIWYVFLAQETLTEPELAKLQETLQVAASVTPTVEASS